ncbi:hypothetical protein MPH_05517 [Macrophomina phaseolina MS6]|uniref:Uncharacterized protein n=1 Tax=Macrophomina phaseolina (strain MS6) TaxID=1126212 RepID=K2RX47_MACPH|nr:hypothetical protein MPH_05517 [Macrophomina phaseolina MS6]
MEQVPFLCAPADVGGWRWHLSEDYKEDGSWHEGGGKRREARTWMGTIPMWSLCLILSSSGAGSPHLRSLWGCHTRILCMYQVMGGCGCVVVKMERDVCCSFRGERGDPEKRWRERRLNFFFPFLFLFSKVFVLFLFMCVVSPFSHLFDTVFLVPFFLGAVHRASQALLSPQTYYFPCAAFRGGKKKRQFPGENNR